MADGSTRRGFLRELVREAARTLHDGDPGPVAAPPVARSRPAPAPTVTASLEALRDLAASTGLGDRADAIRRLARASVRIVPDHDAPATRSWACITPSPRIALSLDDVVAALPEPARAPLGTLLLDIPGPPAAKSSVGPVAVWPNLRHEAGPPSSAPPRAMALRLVGEQTLARPWSAPVEELGLSDDERAAWQELRMRLGELQGAPPADATTELTAVHRVLGYPDERIGQMPSACVALARERGFEHASDAAGPDVAARDWRLLLQLTTDDRLGWDWGEDRQRLYVWVHGEDFDRGRFDRTIALLQ